MIQKHSKDSLNQTQTNPHEEQDRIYIFMHYRSETKQAESETKTHLSLFVLNNEAPSREMKTSPECE